MAFPHPQAPPRRGLAAVAILLCIFLPRLLLTPDGARGIDTALRDAHANPQTVSCCFYLLFGTLTGNNWILFGFICVQWLPNWARS